VDVVEKPDLGLLGSDRRTRRKFIENLKAMSTVVTVTRRGPREGRRSSKPPAGSDRVAKTPSGRPSGMPKVAQLVVLGASTGGPPAVARVLASLSENSPPVVLVQHMSTGFVRGYAEWLDAQVPARVTLAVNGEKVASGHVYVAPDDHHVEVTPYGRLLVYQGPPLRYHRPSVDVLLRSAATTHGKSAVGILLTGMGDDGARGMEALHRAGCFTIAQSKESSVVDGMPAAARDRNAVSWSADCDGIANVLRSLRSDVGVEELS
jgi:two-component system chemotaxis response regulator CheB